METVVVVPLFIVLFASMLFIHHVVAKKQGAQLTARNAAWQSAMSGCSGGAEVPTPDFTSRMEGAPGAEVSLNAFSGQATGSANASVTVSALGAGSSATAQSGGLSFHQNVSSKATVMCNANTQAGDIPGAFRWFTSGDLLPSLIGGP